MVAFIGDIGSQDQIALLGAVFPGLNRDKLDQWPILQTMRAPNRQLPKEQSCQGPYYLQHSECIRAHKK